MPHKSCLQCQREFEIREQDLQLYERISPVIDGVKEVLPLPTLCPGCRQQRRFAWRNVRSIYLRQDSRTSEAIFGQYPPETPFPVYGNDHWWSDDWDAMDYGRDIDFTRPFFEQMHELMHVVPRAIQCNGPGNENSPYVNQTSEIKHCYMVFNADFDENCYFSESIWHSKECLDCFRCFYSELCYELVECIKCYQTVFADHTEQATDCAFLSHCFDVHDCFGCVQVEHGAFQFFNEQLTKEDYQKRVAEIDLTSREVFDYWKQKFLEHRATFQIDSLKHKSCENVVGDYLENCKDCYACYDLNDAENCLYCTDGFDSFKDSIDVDLFGEKINEVYDSLTIGLQASRVFWSYCTWSNVHDVFYADNCSASHDLFGCSGLQHKEYCILNKQYTKEEYFALVKKLIAHMKTTGEWGEYFPLALSPHAYNETLALDFYPQTKEEIEGRGGRWMDEELTKIHQSTPHKFAENDVATLLETAYGCTSCERPIKFIPQELALLLQLGLPLPDKCWKCRFARRFKMRRPRTMYK